MKKYFELNENDSTTYQNLWNAVKAVFTGKFTALIMHILEKISKINHLSFHLGKLRKEEQIKSKESRRIRV